MKNIYIVYNNIVTSYIIILIYLREKIQTYELHNIKNSLYITTDSSLFNIKKQLIILLDLPF